MNLDETQARTPALEQLGHYQLLRQLGQGGMGTVYLAHDTRLDRRVAIKVLPPQSVNDADAVARFGREARALAKLAHPGIVQAYDSETESGRHFLVMEYVEGVSLAALLHDKGRLPSTLAADYIHQAALGLQHAHDKGLVHRDLKPSNLLLTLQGQVKILDLGLARFLQDQIGDPGLTREGTGLGTPDYAAPEQFRDAHKADTRSDIYALGCTLYHLIAGQVAFPGSSLSEKCHAHEHKEPSPLETLCPEVSGGLALVVRRMMAKRPADRFQTARETAEALAPYVAASSASFQVLKRTVTWHGSQLTMKEFKGQPSRRRWLFAGGAVAVLVILGVLAWPHLFSDNTPSEDPDRAEISPAPRIPTEPSGARKKKKEPPGAKKVKPKEALQLPPWSDPDILTVSKDAKNGGTFRTIAEALEKVKPGQTVRVLDSSLYPESLSLTQISKYEGITLEAVRRATIVCPRTLGIVIADVPRVTLRGFRFRGEAERCIAVLVGRQSPGVILEDLVLEPGRTSAFQAISLEQLNLSRAQAPVIVRGCTFRGAAIGVWVSGFGVTYQTPFPSKGIVIRDNLFSGGETGVYVAGSVQQMQIVGNRFSGTTRAAIQLENLLPGSEDILVANNTALECFFALRVWDSSVRGKNIQIRNNLVLGARGPDFVFVNSGGSRQVPKGPGDSRLLHRSWRLDHNWREVRQPSGTDLFSKSWIPPAPREPRDVIKKEIELRARNPDSPHFLCPRKDSPLATGGAGNEDPSLPRYVGAVPPQGVEPWDWRRTWQVWPPGVLLTVSKKAEDGGAYRTITDALQAVDKPGTTIRVLDEASYAESLLIDQAAEQAGITLEASKRATILLTSAARRSLEIKGVPNVRVSGFRFRQSGAQRGSAFITVAAGAPGLVLEDLDLQGSKSVDGIQLQDVGSRTGPPLVIARCAIHTVYDGILVATSPKAALRIGPAGGVAIRQNQVSGAIRGIGTHGMMAYLQVTGNAVWNCQEAALQFHDLAPGSRQILVANNTLFASSYAFRLWDDPPFHRLEAGQVRFVNNLFFDAEYADLGYCLGSEGGTSKKPGDGKSLITLWRFECNRRDLSGKEQADFAIPLSSADKALDKIQLTRGKPSTPNFLRPLKDSEFASKGAGQQDPSLPVYIGAVPPEGVKSWDWERTWKDGVKKPVKSTGSDK